MQVGELSARTGASVRSIRHYESAGLLHATRRDNGYREFDAASIDRVRIIRDLLETGFTVDEIGSLASCLYEPSTASDCCARTVSLYRKKLARVEQQVETLVRLRRRLRDRIATLEPCRPLDARSGVAASSAPPNAIGSRTAPFHADEES